MPDDEDPDDRPRPRRRRPRADEEWGDEPDARPGDNGLHFVVPVNTNVVAILAGYAGLVSVLCFPAPVALVLGVVALIQLKKKPHQHGKGRAIFAVVMGAIFSCLLPFVLYAIAISTMH